jgi:hypothetical protein
MNPSCLRVDKATTFFPSVSIKAAVLAKIKVENPKIKNMLLFVKQSWPKRIKSQIPAVTSVEL